MKSQRRNFSLLVTAAVLMIVGSVFARGLHLAPREQAPQEEKPTQKREIDLKFDVGGPLSPGDSAIFLVGNFAAQHNGAVITCDSAVRYSPQHFKFFGHVLINKNTTYIYGDSAEYDGDFNEARIYSDIIKVVDEDATLYTYQFVYNTQTNIGEFADGGVLTNREHLLESERGYYYGDTKELICVEDVEMRNEEYQMKGDSVVYNMETDNAYFYENTNIWNKEDYLFADEGSFYKKDTLYVITRNGYVLTPHQEMWSDSIDYFRQSDHIILRNDIQIDDQEHKVLAFGDYGEYWKTPGNAMLTKRPSAVTYDLSQGDTVFMRSDTMYLETINLFKEREQQIADSLALVKQSEEDAQKLMAQKKEEEKRLSMMEGGKDADSTGASSMMQSPVNQDRNLKEGNLPDSLQGLPAMQDSLKRVGVDSLNAALQDTTTLTKKQQKAKLKEAARKEKERLKAEKEKLRKEKLDEIAAERRAKNNARLDAEKAREEKMRQARRDKIKRRLQAKRLKAERKGKVFRLIDSATILKMDSLDKRWSMECDSIIDHLFDSIQVAELRRRDSLAMLDSLAANQKVDSLYRLMKGFRNVKIYRSDFQAVCDSLVSVSRDSTMHLYLEPVLWNGKNQITAEIVDVYTKNQQIDRAEFTGDPIMGAEIDTVHYNQVKGKTMISYFKKNEIYRNDVNGNAQTLYWMEDGKPPVVMQLGVLESGDISFYIEEKQVSQIVYRSNPTWHIYPVDQVPPTQELTLQGFQWQGDRRPSKEEVFERKIRPSLRTKKTLLRRPSFPIQERVNRNKTEFFERGSWMDRNEHVDPITEEWMRELGFEVGQPRKGGDKFSF